MTYKSEKESYKIKIAIVGCGRISKKHITAIIKEYKHVKQIFFLSAQSKDGVEPLELAITSYCNKIWDAVVKPSLDDIEITER